MNALPTVYAAWDKLIAAINYSGIRDSSGGSYGASYDGVKTILGYTITSSNIGIGTDIKALAIDAYSKINTWMQATSDYLQAGGTELDSANPKLVTDLGKSFDDLNAKRAALSPIAGQSAVWDGLSQFATDAMARVKSAIKAATPTSNTLWVVLGVVAGAYVLGELVKR